MKEIIVSNLFFGLILSYFALEIGKWVFKKTQTPLCNPFLIGTIIVIVILKVFNISTDDYYKGAGMILFLLGLVGIVSVIVLGKLFGMDDKLIFSLMPKSITTPFGIEVSSMLGGIPAITVVSIMLTGIAGNVTAPLISKIFRVKHSVAVGIGIGVSSHAVGTSKAMEIGEVEGSMSALSIVFAGILTLVWHHF